MGAINKPIVIVTEALVDVQQGTYVPSLIKTITSSNQKVTISNFNFVKVLELWAQEKIIVKHFPFSSNLLKS